MVSRCACRQCTSLLLPPAATTAATRLPSATHPGSVALPAVVCLPAEEHTGRLRAEADAEANARRLMVAQEQWGEYLGQKAGDSSALLERAQALQALLQQMAPSAGGDAAAAAALGEMGRLVEELAVAAKEARASAAQLKAESERSKRSLEQVRGGAACLQDCWVAACVLLLLPAPLGLVSCPPAALVI